MKISRAFALTASLTLVLSGPGGAADASSSDCTRPFTREYSSRRCKVERLTKRSFAVVAVIDTGIDPYHADFRLPGDSDLDGVHPSEFIDGFPETTRALDLSLGRDYESAVVADEEKWDSVEFGELYTFPGTKVVGGITFDDSSLVAGPQWGGRILDEVSGHGTATASLATGMIHSLVRDEDVLVVAIQGYGRDSVEWATQQPWIDVVSNSWGQRANLYQPDGGHVFTRPWVEDQGGTFVASAGNGVTSEAVCDRAVTTTSWMTGPPWHLVVGAVSGWNHQSSCWSSMPPDVSSYGSNVKAAAASSGDGGISFRGTSAAAPIVSGAVAAVILEARRRLHDYREGPRAGLVASSAGDAPLREEGAMADGEVSRVEVEEAVLKTAIAYPFDPRDVMQDPAIWPSTPVHYVYEGYGVVNSRSLRRAMKVLRGSMPPPDRGEVDRWMEFKDTAGSIWYQMP